MATIIASLRNPDGTAYTHRVQFRLLSDPLDGTGTLVGGKPIFAKTTETGELKNADGSGPLTLYAGSYLVQMAHTRRFTALVPSSSESYSLSSLIRDADLNATVLVTQFSIPGATALRAITAHEHNQIEDLAYLLTPGDGRGGKFRYSSTETDAHDGVDIIRPDDVSAESAGRWVRSCNQS